MSEGAPGSLDVVSGIVQNAHIRLGEARDLLAASIGIIDLQTKALLAVEWSGWYDAACDHCCPSCDFLPFDGYHRDGCVIDAALTAAGFHTPEKRDAKRKALGL